MHSACRDSILCRYRRVEVRDSEWLHTLDLILHPFAMFWLIYSLCTGSQPYEARNVSIWSAYVYKQTIPMGMRRYVLLNHMMCIWSRYASFEGNLMQWKNLARESVDKFLSCWEGSWPHVHTKNVHVDINCRFARSQACSVNLSAATYLRPYHDRVHLCACAVIITGTAPTHRVCWENRESSSSRWWIFDIWINMTPVHCMGLVRGGFSIATCAAPIYWQAGLSHTYGV